MPQFKEWLAEQAARESNVAQRRQRVEEWTDAVANLFTQLVNWLAEDDSEKVLTIETSKVQKAEEGLGTYEIAAMRISLQTRLVDLIPLARNVVGGVGKRADLGFRPEGRVDMTNGTDRYMLYRVASPDEKKWVIVDDREYSVRNLTKESFESALQDLMS